MMRMSRPAFFFALIFLVLSPTSAQQQLRIAILPFKIHSQESLSYLSKALHDMLAARLSAEGKIVVVPEAYVEKALREHPSPEATSELGKSLKVDRVIRGSLTKVGDHISIDAELVDIRKMNVEQAFVQGQGIDSVISKVTELSHILHEKMVGERVPLSGERITRPLEVVSTEVKADGKELEQRVKKIITDMERRRMPDSPRLRSRPVLWQSPLMGEEIKGIDAADVDGDGKTEILVLHKNRITIYRYANKGLVAAGRIDGSDKYNFIHLSIADINRNGIPEIFVTSLEGDKPRSFVLEFNKGRGQKVSQDMDWYLRAIAWPGKGRVLLAQKDGPTGDNSGPIYQLAWENGRYVSRGGVPIPWRVGLYDFTPVGVDAKGVENFILLSGDLQPHLISERGQVFWRLKDSYAQSKNQFERVKMSGAGENFPEYTYIPVRLLAVRWGSSSGVRIILPKNDVSAFSIVGTERRILDGEIHSFIWNSQGLLEGWKISGLPGYVADILVKDINGDGIGELVVASVIPGMLGLGTREGRLLAYDIFGASESLPAER